MTEVTMSNPRRQLLSQYVGQQEARTEIAVDDTNKWLAAVVMELRAQRGVGGGTLLDPTDSSDVQGDGRFWVDHDIGTDGDLVIDLEDTSYSLWDIIITNEANIRVQWADEAPDVDKDKYYGNSGSPSKIGGIPVETSYVKITEASDSNNSPVVTVKGWP
jgi:hypothetical protein